MSSVRTQHGKTAKVTKDVAKTTSVRGFVDKTATVDVSHEQSLNIGDDTRVSAVFKQSGVDTDPDAVFLTVKDPSGNSATYEYTVDAALVRASAGNFYLDVDADEEGAWQYRWYATGAGQAAGSWQFVIVGSEAD